MAKWKDKDEYEKWRAKRLGSKEWKAKELNHNDLTPGEIPSKAGDEEIFGISSPLITMGREDDPMGLGETSPQYVNVIIGISAGLFGVGLLYVAVFITTKLAFKPDELILPLNAALFFLIVSLVSGLFCSYVAWRILVGARLKEPGGSLLSPLAYKVLGSFFIFSGVAVCIGAYLTGKWTEGIIALGCTLLLASWCFIAGLSSSGKPLSEKQQKNRSRVFLISYFVYICRYPLQIFRPLIKQLSPKDKKPNKQIKSSGK